MMEWSDEIIAREFPAVHEEFGMVIVSPIADGHILINDKVGRTLDVVGADDDVWRCPPEFLTEAE